MVCHLILATREANRALGMTTFGIASRFAAIFCEARDDGTTSESICVRLRYLFTTRFSFISERVLLRVAALFYSQIAVLGKFRIHLKLNGRVDNHYCRSITAFDDFHGVK